MRRIVQLAYVLFSTGPLMLPACGGTTKDSTPFSSGLPPEKGISNLTQGDQAQLCSGLVDYLHDNRDVVCRFASVTAAALQAAFDSAASEAELRSTCAETFAKCEAEESRDAGPSRCHSADVGSSCTATVHQYEACISEELDELRGFAGQLPDCSTLTLAFFNSKPNGGSSKSEPGHGPACTTFRNRCDFDPLASDSSGSSSDVSKSDAGAAPDAGGFGRGCGDGVIETGEICDGPNFAGNTCATATMNAHATGTLRCNQCQLDTSGCIL